MERKKISQAVINRLPRYYRYLTDISAEGTLRISSKQLSEAMSLTASQIRQDLNCFGGFGQQGYGYNVEYLLNEISSILGAKRRYKAIIAGTGNLGSAIAGSNIFIKRGVTLAGLFDINPSVVGTKIAGFEIMHGDRMPAFCVENSIDIAVLTLPKSETSAIANLLADSGVRGFWNFSNMELKINNPGAVVQNMHMGDSLMTLCYYLSEGK